MIVLRLHQRQSEHNSHLIYFVQRHGLQAGLRGTQGEQKLALQTFVLLDSISLSTGVQRAHGLDYGEHSLGWEQQRQGHCCVLRQH